MKPIKMQCLSAV